MADPFQELGLSRRPLFQVFGLPENQGYASPRMQQAVQNDLITQAAQMRWEQDLADIERRGQAEAAADEFVRQNPDAAMAGSRRYNDILQYQQMQMRGPSYSDAVLSRSLANKLKPAARERFYQNIEAGMGANAAFDDAEAEEEDMKLRVELIEAGVPRATIEGMQGRIDRMTAAELRAAAKGGGDNLADMDKYSKLLEDELEGMKVMGLEPEKGQEGYDAYAAKLGELQQINRMRADALRSRFLKPAETGTEKKIVGQVAQGSAAGASTTTPPPAAPAETEIPAGVSYEQIPSYLKQLGEQKAKVGEKAAVENQWTQQKNALQKRFEKVFPDTKIPGTTTTQLEAIARAVFEGQLVPDESGAVNSETGAPVMIPASDFAVIKAGLLPDTEAFAETGNLRTGPQGVSNRELAKAWAESFLNSRNKLLSTKESATGSILTPEQAKDFEELSKLINPK